MDRYLITDGTRYIAKQKNGQYVADNNMNKALVLPRNEAEKVLNNNLSRAFRKIFRLKKQEKVEVVETPPEVDVMLEDPIMEEAPPAEEYLTNLEDIMAVAEKFLTEPPITAWDTSVVVNNTISEELYATKEVTCVEPVVEEPKKKPKKKKETKHYDTPIHQNEQFMSDMKMVAKYFRDATSHKKEIQDKLDRIEKEITDIRHYIEFKSLNACDGYAAYKMLRQRLIARRECKNELRIMEVLTASVFTAKDIAGIEGIIDSFDTVVYKPRVLTDLFEEKEKAV